MTQAAAIYVIIQPNPTLSNKNPPMEGPMKSLENNPNYCKPSDNLKYKWNTKDFKYIGSEMLNSTRISVALSLPYNMYSMQ